MSSWDFTSGRSPLLAGSAPSTECKKLNQGHLVKMKLIPCSRHVFQIIQIEVVINEIKHHVIPPPPPLVLHIDDAHGPRKKWTKKLGSTNLALKVVNIEEGIDSKVDYFELINKPAQIAKEPKVSLHYNRSGWK